MKMNFLFLVEVNDKMKNLNACIIRFKLTKNSNVNHDMYIASSRANGG